MAQKLSSALSPLLYCCPAGKEFLSLSRSHYYSLENSRRLWSPLQPSWQLQTAGKNRKNTSEAIASWCRQWTCKAEKIEYKIRQAALNQSSSVWKCIYICTFPSVVISDLHPQHRFSERNDVTLIQSSLFFPISPRYFQEKQFKVDGWNPKTAAGIVKSWLFQIHSKISKTRQSRSR